MIGKILFVVAVIVWVTKENKAVNWRLKQNPDGQWDNASLAVLKFGTVLALVLGLTSSFLVQYALFDSQVLALLIAVGVVLAGSWVRVRAIGDLREQFTPNVVILDNHELRCDGIYQHMRHPGYSGALLIHLGLALLLNNSLSLLVMALVLVPCYLYRITVEEKALIQTFGDDYQQYCQRTRRLVPFVY